MDQINDKNSSFRTSAANLFKKDSKFCNCIIFVLLAAMLIVGIFTVNDYGQNWDEYEEITIYIGNLKEYSRLFHGEESEFNREFGDIDFATDNVNIDHGGSLYYIIAPFVKLLYSNNYLAFIYIWRMATWIVFLIGVYFLYASVKRLTSDCRYGLLGAAILLLSPRILSNGFFNHKDIAQLTLWLVMFYLTMRWIQDGGFKWAVPLGIVAAFSINMRIMSAMMYFACGMVYIINLIIDRKNVHRTHVFQGIASIAAFIVAMFLLTPATWDGFFSYFFYCLKNSASFPWGGNVFFMGNLYAGVDLPIYYLFVMIAITTPIIFVILYVIGNILPLIRFARSKTKKKLNPITLLLIISTYLPILVYIVTRPVLYNGWRHYYFLYGFIVIWAVLGVKYLFEIGKPIVRHITGGLVALQCIVMLVVVIATHPFQYTYYNILVGTHPEQTQEMDYWGLAGKQALEELVKQEYSTENLSIACRGYGSTSIFRNNLRVLSDEYRDKLEIKSSADDADYLFVNTMYYKNKNGVGYPDLSQYSECVVIKYFDSPITIIYKKN